MNTPPPSEDFQPEQDDSFTSEEQRVFDMLHKYVESQHQEDYDSCSMYIDDNPRMRELFECLNDLDTLAPGAKPVSDITEVDPPEVGSSESLPTIVLESLKLENFELLEEIGRGGMGVVYRARQTDLQRVVAIKMIRSSSLASTEDVQRFEQEARAAGKLQHPHVVRIFEAGHISGQPYFSMEYIDGHSLFDELSEGQIELKRAVEIIEQIARGVHHLHENKILHRDLKPQNILIDKAGTPYLTDFGLAKMLETDFELTQTGAVLGTPGYMSPEQASPSTGESGAASDVYSLGAVLYHLLTGRPPFSGPNPFETLMAVLESEPLLPRKLNPLIPRELEMICLKCLEKNPEDRFSSALELSQELKRYLQGEPLETVTYQIGHRIKRWLRRELPFVVRISALGLAAGIVQTNYGLFGADQKLHNHVMLVFGLWAAAACCFQWLVNRNRLPNFTRYGWAASDVLFLTWMFTGIENALGPLPAAYALLIVASGLFFQLRLVMFTTGIAIFCYAFLMWVHAPHMESVFYGVIYEALLFIFGVITGHHVRRMNMLNQYFQRNSE